ncbi:MAG: hypothetical protein ACOX6J_05310, partial [Oscillospiraceae bacterium]
MSYPKTLERIEYYRQDIDAVWARMSTIKRLLALMPDVTAVSDSGESGVLSYRGSEYTCEITRYNIRLKGRVAAGLRLSRAGSGCMVHIAVVDFDGSSLPAAGHAADVFVINLDSSMRMNQCIQVPAESSDSALAEASGASSMESGSKGKISRPKADAAGTAEAGAGPSARKKVEHRSHADETVPVSRDRKRRKNVPVFILIILIAAVVGVYWGIFSSLSGPKSSSSYSQGADLDLA